MTAGGAFAPERHIRQVGVSQMRAAVASRGRSRLSAVSSCKKPPPLGSSYQRGRSRSDVSSERLCVGKHVISLSHTNTYGVLYYTWRLNRLQDHLSAVLAASMFQWYSVYGCTHRSSADIPIYREQASISNQPHLMQLTDPIRDSQIERTARR